MCAQVRGKRIEWTFVLQCPHTRKMRKEKRSKESEAFASFIVHWTNEMKMRMESENEKWCICICSIMSLNHVENDCLIQMYKWNMVWDDEHVKCCSWIDDWIFDDSCLLDWWIAPWDVWACIFNVLIVAWISYRIVWCMDWILSMLIVIPALKMEHWWFRYYLRL